MGRLVGIDYGSRRIGIAIADSRGVIVTPATTLQATGSASKDATLILDWAAQNEASGLVLGLPLNMDGSDSAQTKSIRAVAEQIRKRGSLSVELWDERLSSFQADLFLDSAEVPRSRRKGLRDALAAQVILQSYLNARSDAGEAPEPPVPQDP
jgi:putative holliday junction resolvase